MTFQDAVEAVGKIADGIGVAITVVGAVASLLAYAIGFARGTRGLDAYRRVRRGMGRSILLGLEFLVAGDIIRTVAISPSFSGVGVLAAIVVVRTFLSMALEVEIESRWPWQQDASSRSTGKGLESTG